MSSSAPKKTAKSERTRKRIIASYLALLEESDFDKVSVSRICKEAQIVRSTFYVYFDDLYALIQEVEDSALETLRHADDLTDAACAFEAGRSKTDWGFPIGPPYSYAAWFDLCEQEGLTLQAMLGPHGDPYFEQRLKRQIERHVRLTMDHDNMPQDKLREGFVDALVEAHMALIKSWMLDSSSHLTKPQIVTILNAVRIGGSTIGYYAAANNVPSWM